VRCAKNGRCKEGAKDGRYEHEPLENLLHYQYVSLSYFVTKNAYTEYNATVSACTSVIVAYLTLLFAVLDDWYTDDRLARSLRDL
jgi:hypothetical protein